MIDLEDTFYNDLKDPELDLLTTWIGRSRAIPISVWLFYEVNKFMKWPRSWASYPTRSAWRAFTLARGVLNPYFAPNPFRRDGGICYKSSPSFPIPHSMTQSSSTFKGPISLHALHSLCKLTVKVRNSVSMDYLIAPWAQLVYLHMDGTCSLLPDYLGILVKCTNLEEYLIYIQDVYHSSSSPSSSTPRSELGSASSARSL